MITKEKTVSVPQAASLCGVTRSTVNHWIKTNKFHAKRSGRNYSVPVKELFLFLKATGRKIPFELESDDLSPVFKAYRRCWNYWKDSDHGDGCNGCVVSDNQIEICFTAKNSSRLNCSSKCDECVYYQDIYLPRVQFIHQFDFPAAVCKGLFFWGVNSRWSKICQVPDKNSPGTGVEGVIHQESVESVISLIKKLELGESVQSANSVYLKTENEGKLEVIVSFFPLNQPQGTFLILAKPQDA
ncbi:MAG: helix-turn-helix domain-containing protein [Bacteroidales bacterium]|nr:helix-turn-helix domain-containing protein [Bacteroidales bacterium]